MPLGILVSPAF